MTYYLLREVTTLARKAHRCIWCGQGIEAGTKYIRERSVYDGHMQNFAWHPECQRASSDYFRHEEEFEPHEHERPDYRLVDGATP